MASRTWNAVDISIFDEDWSELAIVVALLILGKCTNQYGVYDLPRGFIRRFCRALGHPDIDPAIQELEASGFIQLFDSGSKVWIRSKFKRELPQVKTDAYRMAMRDFISKHPEIEADWSRRYLDPIQTPSRPPLLACADSDSDSDSEKNKDMSKPAVSRRRAKPAVLPIPELEAKLPPEAAIGWQLFQQTVAAENKDGKVAESRLAGLLAHILDRVEMYHLSPVALAYGFAQANQNGAGNANYVIKSARGYTPDTSFQPPPVAPRPVEPPPTPEQIKATNEAFFRETQGKREKEEQHFESGQNQRLKGLLDEGHTVMGALAVMHGGPVLQRMEQFTDEELEARANEARRKAAEYIEAEQ